MKTVVQKEFFAVPLVSPAVKQDSIPKVKVYIANEACGHVCIQRGRMRYFFEPRNPALAELIIHELAFLERDICGHSFCQVSHG